MSQFDILERCLNMMKIEVLKISIHEKKHGCGKTCKERKIFSKEFEFYESIYKQMKKIYVIGDKVILGEIYCDIVSLHKSLIDYLHSHKNNCFDCSKNRQISEKCENFEDQKRKIHTVSLVRKYIEDKLSNRTIRKKIESNKSLFNGRGFVILSKEQILSKIEEHEEMRFSHFVECKHCFQNPHPIDGKREGVNAYGCTLTGGGGTLIYIETYRKQLGMYYPEEYKERYGKTFRMQLCKQ